MGYRRTGQGWHFIPGYPGAAEPIFLAQHILEHSPPRTDHDQVQGPRHHKGKTSVLFLEVSKPTVLAEWPEDTGKGSNTRVDLTAEEQEGASARNTRHWALGTSGLFQKSQR